MRQSGATRAMVFCLVIVAVSGKGWAEGSAPLRIGVLADMSGTTSDLGGKGSVVAAQMAVDDNGG